VDLEPGRRIVQSWRSGDFPFGSEDSRLEIVLEPIESGTRVTFMHTEIPEGQATHLEQGWRERYLEPLSRYFDQEPSSTEDTETEDEDEEMMVSGDTMPRAPTPAPSKPSAKPRKAAAPKPAAKAAAKPAPKKPTAKKPAPRKAKKAAKVARAKSRKPAPKKKAGKSKGAKRRASKGSAKRKKR
jgi:hypothetical protein